MKLLLIMFCILCVSCESDELGEPAALEGTFTGVFIRSSPDAKYQPADVVLNLQGNQFLGSSNIARYPAICQGTFEVGTGKIRFADGCVWTADFDWTYILNGEFELTLNGDELTLRRSYAGAVHDLYALRRQRVTASGQ